MQRQTIKKIRLLIAMIILAGMLAGIAPAEVPVKYEVSSIPEMRNEGLYIPIPEETTRQAEIIWAGDVYLDRNATFTITPVNDPAQAVEINRATPWGALDAASAAGGFPYEAAMQNVSGGTVILAISSIDDIAEDYQSTPQLWWGFLDEATGRILYDPRDVEVAEGDVWAAIYFPNIEDLSVDDIIYVVEMTIHLNKTPPIPPSPPVPGNDTVMNLYAGWNFVSTPKQLAEGSDTVAIFSGVETGGRSIYRWDPAGGFLAMNASEKFEPLEGIWIYANSTTEVPLIFYTDPLRAPPEKTLLAGWNAIGFTDTTELPARDALTTVKDTWAQVIGFNASQQTYDPSIFNGGTGVHDENRMLYPYNGYWLFMNEDGTIAAISI